jgi:hypothetical protein
MSFCLRSGKLEQPRSGLLNMLEKLLPQEIEN